MLLDAGLHFFPTDILFQKENLRVISPIFVGLQLLLAQSAFERYAHYVTIIEIIKGVAYRFVHAEREFFSCD
jgi:hypothetical protein